MIYRRFGSSNIEVSEVGLGCWQLGGDWGINADESLAFSILQEAVDNGVNFFDTADVYGSGQSEKLIGEFLKSSGKEIQIATKYGRGPGVFPNGYTEKSLRESVENSLVRLGLERLDLIQLHCIPRHELEKGDVFKWLRGLKNEGLIKHFGASVETIEEGHICMKQEDLFSLQVIFNIFRQRLVSDLLPMAKEKGVGIIVRLPLASGLLSGKFTADSVFSESDHRNYNKDGEAFSVGETFAGIEFDKGLELVNSIKNNFLPKHLTMVELALRWILDNDAVSCIIPGASSPGQVAANVKASSITPLGLATHTALQNFYQHSIHKHIRGPY